MIMVSALRMCSQRPSGLLVLRGKHADRKRTSILQDGIESLNVQRERFITVTEDRGWRTRKKR